ncbi:MAG: helix-turn-helix transcriptional regulator [Bacillota bacterium]
MATHYQRLAAAKRICLLLYSQQTEEQSDGGLLLKLTVSGLGEVKRWVLSFGPNAEVLAPENLRQEVAWEVRKMAAKYCLEK